MPETTASPGRDDLLPAGLADGSSTGIARPRARTAEAGERRRRLIGIALMCAAIVCFSGIDTTAKWLTRSMDPMLAIWARYASSVVLVSLFVNGWTHPGLLRTRRPWLQAGRSLLLLGSTALNFFALQYLQLAQTTSILFATPLLVALLAGPLLGEWIGPRRLAAIAVGFVGILIVTRPGFGDMHPAALLSVLGACCYALYSIATRVLASSDSSATTLTYSGAAGLLLITPALPFVWTNPPSVTVAVLMVVLGAFGAAGHWLLILAHARAPAPVLAPFIYGQIVLMIALGYVVFGDVPDRFTLLGAAVVIASGLYLLHRERIRGASRRAR